MKTGLLLTFVSLLSLSLVAAPISLEGVGSGGGGDGITIDGKSTLRDFLTDKIPTILTSDTVLQMSGGGVQKIIREIALQDINLATDLAKSFNRVTFWKINKELKVLPANVTSLFGEPADTQYAIRVEDDIFLSNTFFSELNSEEQSYVVIHELLHELVLPKEFSDPLHHDRLRAFVNYLKVNNDHYQRLVEVKQKLKVRGDSYAIPQLNDLSSFLNKNNRSAYFTLVMASFYFNSDGKGLKFSSDPLIRETFDVDPNVSNTINQVEALRRSNDYYYWNESLRLANTDLLMFKSVIPMFEQKDRDSLNTLIEQKIPALEIKYGFNNFYKSKSWNRLLQLKENLINLNNEAEENSSRLISSRGKSKRICDDYKESSNEYFSLFQKSIDELRAANISKGQLEAFTKEIEDLFMSLGSEEVLKAIGSSLLQNDLIILFKEKYNQQKNIFFNGIKEDFNQSVLKVNDLLKIKCE